MENNPVMRAADDWIASLNLKPQRNTKEVNEDWREEMAELTDQRNQDSD